jgi:hypothetical protein
MNRLHKFIIVSPKQQETEKRKRSFNWTIIPAYIGLVATAISVYYTSRTVRESEKWRKGEFIAAQFEKFNQDSSVEFVTGFLDYYSRLVTFEMEGTSSLSVDDIAEYLFPVDLSPDADPLKRGIIRGYFDDYLDRLSVFNRYINAGLVKQRDVEPYLVYQLKIIDTPGDEERLKSFQEALWSYIERYSFSDVQELLCKFGFNIYPSSKSNLCHNAGSSELNSELMKTVESEKGLDFQEKDTIVPIR